MYACYTDSDIVKCIVVVVNFQASPVAALAKPVVSSPLAQSAASPLMQSPPSESVSDVSGTSSHHVRNPRSCPIYPDVEPDTDVETPEPAAKAPEPVVQSMQPTALPPSPVKPSPVQQSAQKDAKDGFFCG